MGTTPMPTTQEHQDKQSMTELARSDLEQSPNNPQHADWIVTLAFYKALHAVDSYFANEEFTPKGMWKEINTSKTILVLYTLEYDGLFDILPTLKGWGFCYHRGMPAVASLTLSPAKVDVPTL